MRLFYLLLRIEYQHCFPLENHARKKKEAHDHPLDDHDCF